MKKDVKLQKTKKKGFPHTQSTNNYCLISSTFQKKFQKKTSIVNLEKKQKRHKKYFIFSTSEQKLLYSLRNRTKISR